jgi:hypothetical protein
MFYGHFQKKKMLYPLLSKMVRDTFGFWSKRPLTALTLRRSCNAAITSITSVHLHNYQLITYPTFFIPPLCHPSVIRTFILLTIISSLASFVFFFCFFIFHSFSPFFSFLRSSSFVFNWAQFTSLRLVILLCAQPTRAQLVTKRSLPVTELLRAAQRDLSDFRRKLLAFCN